MTRRTPRSDYHRVSNIGLAAETDRDDFFRFVVFKLGDDDGKDGFPALGAVKPAKVGLGLSRCGPDFLVAGGWRYQFEGGFAACRRAVLGIQDLSPTCREVTPRRINVGGCASFANLH